MNAEGIKLRDVNENQRKGTLDQLLRKLLSHQGSEENRVAALVRFIHRFQNSVNSSEIVENNNDYGGSPSVTKLTRPTDDVYNVNVGNPSSGGKSRNGDSQSENEGEARKNADVLLLLEYLGHDLTVNRWQLKLNKATKHPLFHTNESELEAWQKVHNNINQFETYNRSDQAVRQAMWDLANQPMTRCTEMVLQGTQIKLLVDFQNGARAIFKPKRVARDKELDPNMLFYVDMERHTAEIAGFHLDRALQFHRVPPTVGRSFSMTGEIEKICDKDLTRTKFISPGKNHCILGKCKVMCALEHPICGEPDLVEGALSYLLPTFGYKHFVLRSFKHPWQRTYSHLKLRASWQDDPAYCHNLRFMSHFNSGRRLLDIMDLSVFDFLTGNLDRHHYTSFYGFGNYTSLIYLDQGRGFSLSSTDIMSLLGPVSQCCQLRKSTLQILLQFQTGPIRLSDIMKKTLSQDSLPDILTQSHLTALDRKVVKILQTVTTCVHRYGFHRVIIDDGF